MPITVFTEIPEEITLPEKELLEWLAKPSLFHLDFGKEKTFLVTGMLHGNEPSGFRAIVQLLKQIRTEQLTFPFNLLLFIGNVEAAKTEPLFSHRVLEGQRDFNRIWAEDTTHPVSGEVIKHLRTVDLLGGLDLHNNTGKNPMYTISVSLAQPVLQLAYYLSSIHLFFEEDIAALVNYLADKPFVAVECGQRLTREADDAGKRVLKQALAYFTKVVTNEPIAVKPAHMYHKIKQVKVKAGLSISADGSDADFKLRSDIEEFNFKVLPQGSVVGTTTQDQLPVVVRDQGNEITPELFSLVDGELRLKRDFIVLMAKANPTIIRQTHLFFLAEELISPTS